MKRRWLAVLVLATLAWLVYRYQHRREKYGGGGR